MLNNQIEQHFDVLLVLLLAINLCPISPIVEQTPSALQNHLLPNSFDKKKKQYDLKETFKNAKGM